MAVARILHTLLLNELQVVLGRIGFLDDFAALEHAIGQGLEVAAANHVYTWLLHANLNHLEVVREVSAELDELMLKLFCQRIKTRNCFTVFLEDVNQLREL